jgi:hypothetical protein
MMPAGDLVLEEVRFRQRSKVLNVVAQQDSVICCGEGQDLLAGRASIAGFGDGEDIISGFTQHDGQSMSDTFIQQQAQRGLRHRRSFR